MPFQASGGAISRLPPNKAAPQAPPRAGAGRAALAETQHGLEAAHTNSRSPRPLATSQASAPKPKPVDTIGHHAPQARVTGQGRHVGWRPSCLPGGSTTPSLCLPTPFLYPGKTKQVSAQGNPGWKWGTGAGMGPTAPDLKHPRGLLRRGEGEEGRAPGWDVLPPSPGTESWGGRPLMLIPPWWGPARAREPPRAWLGTRRCLPPPGRARGTCQHTHASTPHFSFSIYFLLRPWQSKQRGGGQRAPERGAAAWPRPGARERYFGPSRLSPRSWCGRHIFQKPK